MRLLQSGTRVVAGVAPGRAGEVIEGVPVFASVREAVEKTGASATMILVPPAAAPAAVRDALSASIPIIVLITEHIPAQSALDLIEEARQRGRYLNGPNTAGLIMPGRIKIGIMAHEMYSRGPVALISRSGTLMSEVAHQLKIAGIGQSVCIDIGGDPIVGHGFVDVLRWISEDGTSRAVAVLGEIGGAQEEDVCEYLTRGRFALPVYGLVVGHAAPPGKRMGHAGALISDSAGTAAAKSSRLTAAGVSVSRTVDELVVLMAQELKVTCV
jgi:succinyl-CoA synthetase alpha subunit